MTNIYLPIFGQGSQPKETDGADLDFMSMPKQMLTYTRPQFSGTLEPQSLAKIKALLEQVLQALQHYTPTQWNKFYIHNFDDRELAFLNEILGEGEVSIIQEGEIQTKIQESVLAGVWRVQCFDPKTGDLHYDGIEVGDIPETLKDHTFDDAQKQLHFDPNDLPNGLMNALPLIAELNTQIAGFQADNPPYVINLSLLPQSEADLEFLYQTLGKGTTSILSRGYGTNRITSTMTKNVWWVQYFNSEDKLILNPLEISQVPSVACAAPEDLADSAVRLQEILALLT